MESFTINCNASASFRLPFKARIVEVLATNSDPAALAYALVDLGYGTTPQLSPELLVSGTAPFLLKVLNATIPFSGTVALRSLSVTVNLNTALNVTIAGTADVQIVLLKT